ncbi:MAG: 4-hydroxythreonine-4-phosphate dehydrogenase PdxA [Anaerolineales bacterium]|jgi:4-hydroxythreonine-4-phosphate dehydrogenase|nr:4-hydroxythreonine-4-phosphate dehydrogenase PdxA [Anaerolineales bacterium]
MSAPDRRQILAITMGDPAGIGPEIVLKALQDPEVYQHCRPVVIGDRRILERASAWVETHLKFEVVTDPAEGKSNPGVFPLIDLENARPEDCPVGEVSAAAGRAAVGYVEKACDLALAGEVDAMVTAPLNKESINLAGFAYPGHTELLKERTRADRVTMLLVGPNLRVVHVSTHVSLAQAVKLVKKERIDEVITLAHEACRALGIAQPRVAVAGLNPHAGESRLFGDQEQLEIIPAVEAARARGMDVSDPQPPDTVFLRAAKGFYDIVVAMYHDQGHIPMKLLAFDDGVNVSIGLPIIRTSVDHGTAFDIAGTGQAKESSLLAAMDVAIQMVNARKVSK